MKKFIVILLGTIIFISLCGVFLIFRDKDQYIKNENSEKETVLEEADKVEDKSKPPLKN